MHVGNVAHPLTIMFSALNFIYNVGNHNRRDSLDEDTNVIQYEQGTFNSSVLSNSMENLFRWTTVIDTPLGKLRGTRHRSRIGKTFYNFRGIPFAKAPVGNLRYEAPQPHPGWNGILEATSYRSPCLQLIYATRMIFGKEDCLFLNIATRSLPKEGSKKLLPVIVFIHGGLFMIGASNPHRPKYFMDEEVVLVTLNYRLNSFGFLNTQDGVVTGNMGMKDQVMALKWVQENIKYFNGDPTRVTISGTSAGGASVHLHTMSPMSQGLFHRAISFSGTALSPWTVVPEPGAQTTEFAEGVGCPTWNSHVMVKCLKSLPAKTLAKSHAGYINDFSHGKQSIYGPTVEFSYSSTQNVFLPAHPTELLKERKVQRVPWITGITSGEGLIYLIALLRNDTLRQLVNTNWDDFAPVLLRYEGYNKRVDFSASLKEFYLNNEPLSLSTASNGLKMLSDRGFFLDNHDAAILHSMSAPTYTYFYNYRGVFELANLLFYKAQVPFLPNDQDYAVGTGLQWVITNVLNKRRKNNGVDLGVCHGDDLPILFNMPMIRRQITTLDPDFEFSRKFIRLLVSFAETGIPNMAQVGEPGLLWNTVRSQNPRFKDRSIKRLYINDKFALTEEPYFGRLGFWKNHSFSSLDEII